MINNLVYDLFAKPVQINILHAVRQFQDSSKQVESGLNLIASSDEEILFSDLTPESMETAEPSAPANENAKK